MSGWAYRYLTEEGWSVEVAGRRAADTTFVSATVEVKEPGRAAWGRWLPGRELPGPALLSPQDALLQLRFRPAGGLAISSNIGTQSLADRLFSLKSELFTAAVLAGNIELAVYLPDGLQLIPPATLALDFALAKPAILAMEGFIEDLRERYPVSRSDYSFAGYSGACLTNLRVLPDLEPCYVATDQALVIGWNPDSIRLALMPSVTRESEETHRLLVFLDQFAEADRLLAAAHGRDSGAALVYPWRSLRISGQRASDVVRFDLELEPGGGQ